MRPALDGGTYSLRGDVVRMARQVAYAEASVTDADGPVGQPVDRHLPAAPTRRRGPRPADRHAAPRALAAGGRPRPAGPCRPTRGSARGAPGVHPSPCRPRAARPPRSVRHHRRLSAVRPGGPRARPVCFCCRLVARQLGLPLVRTVVVREYRVGDDVHRWLRGYKDAPTAESRGRHPPAGGRRSGGVDRPPRSDLDRWLGPWAAVTPVPSTRRPGPLAGRGPARHRARPGGAPSAAARPGEGSPPGTWRPAGTDSPRGRAWGGTASRACGCWCSTTASPRVRGPSRPPPPCGWRAPTSSGSSRSVGPTRRPPARRSDLRSAIAIGELVAVSRWYTCLLQAPR